MSDRDMYIKQLEEKLTRVVRGTGRTTVCVPVLDLAIIVNLLKESQEQKHGHWVSAPDKSPKTTTINMHSFIYSCSECGKAVGHHAEYNYCPGCGAIMTRMVKQDE